MKEYSKLEGIYKDSPLVVVGNGPSLSDVPVELFEKYPTMACNSVYASGYFKDNTPDWYVIEGLGHLKTDEERKARMPYIKKVAKNNGATLVNRRVAQHFQHLKEVYFIDYINEKGQHYNSFQFNPFDFYGTGACVTYAMLQFAHFLTEGPVLLVGIDHSFKGKDWHFFTDEEAGFESMPIQEYQKFRMRVDPKFEEVAKVFEMTDRKLINLTPKSVAYMFTAGEYKEWI